MSISQRNQKGKAAVATRRISDIIIGKRHRREMGDLDALGAEPGHTCMVGDNLDFDVEGARRVGIAGVWVDRARTGLPPGSTACPDHVIASLTDLFVIR